jgi:ADP-ribosylation factor protein 1
MGLAASKLLDMLTFRHPTRVLMLGLDAAGKTCMLYKLKLGEVVTSIPTVGFNVETVQYRNLSMTIWDVGGQDKIRALWRYYYEKSDALIFIVDSNDPMRFAEARDEMHRVLSDDALRNTTVLVLANKQDMPRALPVNKIADAMGLNALTKHMWYIQGCSALTGEGLYEGLEWLHGALRSK